MQIELRNLRAVISQPEHDFGTLLGRVLSPSQPLTSEEFLRGREDQLSGIKRALYQSGRHVLIHGLRGVGKSSLAHTAAYSLSLGADPIILGCDGKSSFGRVMREMYDDAVNKNPLVEKKVKESGGGFSLFGANFREKTTTQEMAASEPGSVNQAVRLVQCLCEIYAEKPVIVIDEFDQFKSREEKDNDEVVVNVPLHLSGRLPYLKEIQTF